MLRPGDILTHCCTGGNMRVLGDDGHVLPELRRLHEAGVVLDVGHGTGSFAYATAEATFDLSDDDGLFLGGVASLIDFSEDLLVLTFSGLDGSAAAAFGSTLTFELFFVDAVGADPLAGLDDGGIYSVAGVGVGVGSEDVAPVPLPATGSLLLAVLGSAAGLSFMRRTCVG